MTEQTTGTDWLTRVRALLAKAEATTHEAEAETYNAKARELIARHGIDEALAYAAGRVRDEVGQRTIYVEAPYALDKRGLIEYVYAPLGCRTVRMMGRERADGAMRVDVFGYTADLDRAELLYTSLLLQAVGGMNRAARGYSAARSAANRRAWLAGFGRSVSERLTEAEARARGAAAERARDEGTSTALVVTDREQAVDRFVGEAIGKVCRSRRSLSGSGYGDGRAAGRRADLGGGRVGSGARPALGR